MNKKTLFFLSALLSCGIAYGQTNTFPANGSVGIGTLTPEENWKLDVNGPGTIGNAGSARIYLGTVNPTTAFIQSRNLTLNQMLLFSASSYNFDIGNVGIGNSTPTSSLDIATTSVYADEKGALKIRSKTANQFMYLSYLDQYSAASLQVIKPGVSAQNFLLNPQGGNVGIGTTNPTEKLSVNGKIRAQEIKVEAANWPDYVFDEDYKITSLSDLGKFIKVYKHLPNMPSANEVATNGVDLGNIVKLQQQKIEELTLHLIEKDKQVINQEKRLLEIENLLRNTQNITNEDYK